MLKVKVYNSEGQETGEQDLKPEIFGVPVKTSVIQSVIEAILANRRKVIAHTKTRGQVRGGGRKPWRQKGTGRARHGSIRSPLWVGGGVTFGPTNERNYQKKINKKVKRLALLMGLSDKVKNNHLFVLEDIMLNEAKTKKLAQLISTLPVEKKKVLLAVSPNDKLIFTAGRNIQKLQVIAASSLNIYDVLSCPYLVLTQKGLETVYQTFKSKQNHEPAK